MNVMRFEDLQEGSLERLQAFCRMLGTRAKAADWLGAERIADDLAAAWGAARPSILSGLAGRGAATVLDGTLNWISVAIGRRDSLSTLKAAGALAGEIGALRRGCAA
jgi:hypothetical protein